LNPLDARMNLLNLLKIKKKLVGGSLILKYFEK
jgi:hypothetical protein